MRSSPFCYQNGMFLRKISRFLIITYHQRPYRICSKNENQQWKPSVNIIKHSLLERIVLLRSRFATLFLLKTCTWACYTSTLPCACVRSKTEAKTSFCVIFSPRIRPFWNVWLRQGGSTTEFGVVNKNLDASWYAVYIYTCTFFILRQQL